MLTLQRASPIPRRQRGFSLTEMMVALVAGLIVVGSVLVFTVAMARSTGQNIQAARLNQDLRAALSLVTKEIRRAGYFRQNHNYIASNSFTQPYAALCMSSTGTGTCSDKTTSTFTGSCLRLAYDRYGVNDGSTSPGATEYKAFRIRTVGGVGQIEANLADNPPDCSSTSSTNWLVLTNPNVIDVTALTFALTSSTDSIGTNPTNGNNINVSVRDILVTATARLRADNSVSRTISEDVRIRADVVSN